MDVTVDNGYLETEVAVLKNRLEETERWLSEMKEERDFLRERMDFARKILE